MKKPRQPSEYAVRFERGQFVLVAGREDARLTIPVRVALSLAGLLVAALGFGLATLVCLGVGEKGSSVPTKLAAVIFFPLVLAVALYGCDLVGRGIVGRPWSQRFWNAADGRLARVKSGKMTLALLVLIVAPPLLMGFGKGLTQLDGLLSLLAIFLHVLCHEMGHLATAGAVGYRPRWLKAGPLVVHVDGPRTRLALNRSWLLFFGGLAAYEPVGQTPGKDLLVTSAGPLTNLLLAVAALELWGWPNPSSGFEIFLRSFIGLGIAIAILNLIPLPRTSQGSALDGRELLDLLRGRR
jgi:hypothetical protein